MKGNKVTRFGEITSVNHPGLKGKLKEELAGQTQEQKMDRPQLALSDYTSFKGYGRSLAPPIFQSLSSSFASGTTQSLKIPHRVMPQFEVVRSRTTNNAVTERINQTEDYFQKKTSGAQGSETDYFFVDDKQFVYSRDEWLQILQNHEPNLISKKKLRESIMQGIPEDLRPHIWMFLCKTKQAKATYKKDVFRKLKLIPNQSEDYAIEKDLARTFSDTKQFKEPSYSGKNPLFNVLRAYANFDKEVGYCQGTNFIAALLIIVLKDEQLAFWTFVNIMTEKNWRLVFVDGTPKLMDMLDRLKNDLSKRFPLIWRHLCENEVLVESVFSQAFITLFIYYTEIKLAKRIFEIFLVGKRNQRVEGELMIFRMITKMLKLNRDKILGMDMSQLHHFLRFDMVTDCLLNYTLKELVYFETQAEKDAKVTRAKQALQSVIRFGGF